MKSLTKTYGKYKNFIENLLFPAALFLYPFLTVNQGLDVADSTYSLTNFQYFGAMKGTWMVATFLSNAVGWLFGCLPFGETLLGIKCYTTMVLSATALMVYFGLRKKIPAPLLFFGEILALGLCWCPSTILYNYLTYFLMTAGMLLLYRGLTGAGQARLCFAVAGVCLGANVAVRMPNVVQAAFILAVWYGIVLCQKKNGCYVEAEEAAGKERVMSAAKKTTPVRTLAVSTGWCLLGYAAGFGVPFLAICVRYGVSAYPDMVRTMFAMTEQATDYRPSSMISGMFTDYGKGLYWLAFAGMCAVAAAFAFYVREKLYGMEGKRNTYRITGVIIKAGYVLLLLILLRFYWGRGMFHFRYYQYGNGSIYYPAVLLLLAAIAAAVRCLFGKRMRAEQKILAALVLLQIFLTPLGSNNYLYPIINNLFVAAPFFLWVVSDGIKASAAKRQNGAGYDFVWYAPMVFLFLFVLVQSMGSHAGFVFQDGIYGERRDTCVAVPKKAAGVYTNAENAALLEELRMFTEEEGVTGRTAITYGELPGLYYLLDMPPALSTGWPDLNSYRMTEYERDLAALEAEIAAGGELPVIIVSSAVAAYWSDDGEAISWFGVDMKKMQLDEKQRILGDWVRDYGYTERFGNARYVVYCAE